MTSGGQNGDGRRSDRAGDHAAIEQALAHVEGADALGHGHRPDRAFATHLRHQPVVGQATQTLAEALGQTWHPTHRCSSRRMARLATAAAQAAGWPL